MDQGLALADWNGFDARAARIEAARQAARPRHRHLPRMDRRQRVRGEGDGRRARPTASSRSSRRRQAMGQGIRPATRSWRSTCSACRSRRCASCQGDTDRGNGFGSAGSRSLFTGGSAVKVGAERTIDQAKGLAARGARGGGRRHRVPRRPLLGGRHRSRHRPVRAGRQAGRSSASIVDATSDRGRADAGRTAAMSARSRSIPTAGDVQVVSYASVNDIGRVVSPTIVRGQVDGGAVQGIGQALLRADRLRRRQRPARHRQLHGLRDAAGRGPAGVPHRVRHLDPLPDQPARASRASASSAPSAPRRR